LRDTIWGRVWVVQAVLLAVFAAALVAARPQNDAVALAIAIPAALGLAAIPSLSGHAMGAETNATLVVINDALHVGAAGTWIGTLTVLAFVALPTAERTHVPGSVARLIGRFSNIALSAAAIVIASGVVNSLLHFTTVSQLLDTDYGRTLLLKIAFVACVVGTGAYNWKRLQPRLAAGGTVNWRRSVTFELAFALMVFIATAYLSGLPRPG
jgi:putative copper export protein